MSYAEGKEYKSLPENPQEMEFIDCTFIGVNFSDQSVKNSKFIDCKFNSCNCSGLNVLNTTFRDSQYENSKLMGINWSLANTISNLMILNSQLDFSVFQNLDLSQSVFENSSVREVDFSDSKLVKAKFVECNLAGSIFNGCDLSGADLSSALDYTIDPNFTKLKKAKFSMPEAMSLLRSLDIIIE